MIWDLECEIHGFNCEETKERGRIQQEERGNFVVCPSEDISLFTKRIFNTIIAIQEYIKLLQRDAAEAPQGGEHEDILIAESVLRELSRAKAALGVSEIPHQS